jgi:peptidoglycan/LPS O-acetylase OafA/YrhL
MVAVAERAASNKDGRQAEAAPVRAHYRPYLDGIRALAVYLVVAFHAQLRPFDGGFIGVDVFFVLSGYLVTQLLLRELRGNTRIRLGTFYARRVRRLLPALVVCLLVTAIAYAGVVSRAEAADQVDAFKAAFLYVANWFFIHQQTDYFAPRADSSPVLHIWSLAVEEQFYLLWPLLLSGLALIASRAKRSWHVMRIAVGVGAALSVLWALHLRGANPARAYYGTDARAYQLLAGALLALTPQIISLIARHRTAARTGAVAATVLRVVAATTMLDVGPIPRGIAATALTCLLIASMEAARGGIANTTYSTQPVVYLGRISYATYLWHWPVIIITTRLIDISAPALFAMTCLVATGLASLSFHDVEWPIRDTGRMRRVPWVVVALGVATTVVAGLVIAPRVLDSSRDSTVAVGAGAVSGVAPVPAGLDWQSARDDKATFPTCDKGPVDDCILVHGSGAHVMLVGDSHAATLIGAFEDIARRNDLTLSVAVSPGCPWQQGLYYPVFDKQCRKRKDDWYNRVIPELQPDVIVVTSLRFDDPERPIQVLLDADGGGHSFGDDSYEELARTTTLDTLPLLEQTAQRVVILQPVPTQPAGFDPGACLSTASYLDECRFVTTTEPTPLERTYAEQASDSVAVVDIDQAVCPYLPICDPVVNGSIVRANDDSHLTVHFATTLADPIEAALKRDGVLG